MFDRISIPLGRASAALRVGAACAVLLGWSAALGNEKVVRVAVDREISTQEIGVAGHGGTYGFSLAQPIHETLVKLDFDLRTVPWLAESWEQLDDVTYRVNIRQGVRFHSGNPLNAEAVRASLWRTHLNPDEPGSDAGYLDMVVELAVIDEYTLEFSLERPFGAFIQVLGMPHQSIMDIAHLEDVGREVYGSERPSGTGPFRMVSWQRGERMVLEANRDYWQQGKPLLDRLEFHFIPEGASRAIALELGEVDLAWDILPQDVPRIEASGETYVITGRVQRPVAYHLNLRNPILQDVNHRRALAHAIDNELIAEVILGDQGEPLNAFAPPDSFGALDTPYAYDPEFSGILLESMGWRLNRNGIYERDGMPFSLTVFATGAFPRDIEVSEAIQQQVREHGIDLQVRRLEWATFRTDMEKATWDDDYNPEWDIYPYGIGVRTGDSGLVLEAMYADRDKGGLRNAHRYVNPAYDAVLGIGMGGYSDEIRIRAFAEAQRILYADVAAIPLYVPVLIAGAREGVVGYQLHPVNIEFWEDLDIE